MQPLKHLGIFFRHFRGNFCGFLFNSAHLSAYCFCSFLVSYQVADLEEIHKKVLSSQDSATREATAVRRALTSVYQVIKVCT